MNTRSRKISAALIVASALLGTTAGAQTTGTNSGAVGTTPPTAVTGTPKFTPSPYGYNGGYYPYNYPGVVYTPYGYYYPQAANSYPGYYYSAPYNGYTNTPNNGYPYGYGLPNPNGGVATYYRPNGSVNRTPARKQASQTRATAPRAGDSVAPRTVDQERTARRAQEVMAERPLREGTVVRMDNQQVRIRFSNRGTDQEDSVPTKEVFFFRKDGGIVTAANSAELLQTGDKVLFPDPTAQPRSAVAGERQVSHPAASSTIRKSSAKQAAAKRKAVAARKKASRRKK